VRTFSPGHFSAQYKAFRVEFLVVVEGEGAIVLLNRVKASAGWRYSSTQS
jgi:uncharacterized cupin superfamily protein